MDRNAFIGILSSPVSHISNISLPSYPLYRPWRVGATRICALLDAFTLSSSLRLSKLPTCKKYCLACEPQESNSLNSMTIGAYTTLADANWDDGTCSRLSWVLWLIWCAIVMGLLHIDHSRVAMPGSCAISEARQKVGGETMQFMRIS